MLSSEVGRDADIGLGVDPNEGPMILVSVLPTEVTESEFAEAVSTLKILGYRMTPNGYEVFLKTKPKKPEADILWKF